MDQREKRSVRRAAWALLAVFAVGAAYIVVARHAPQWIRPSRTFEFYQRRASGVEVGTPVWVNGIEAGKVIRMSPEVVPATFLGGKPQEGKVLGVKVACRILAPFHRLLREGSTAEVVATSVFGGMRVNVIPGMPGSPRSPNNAVLDQRMERGIEGAVEELVARVEAIDRRRAQIEVYLDSIGKDAEEIDANYSKGRNTLHTFLEKGPEFDALKDLTDRLQAMGDPVKRNFDGIKADVDRIDPEAGPRIREDAKAAADGLQAAGDRGREAAEAFGALRGIADETQDSTLRVFKKMEAFQKDFKVFMEVKNLVVPELLAAWAVVQKQLVGLALRRIKLSAREDPGIDEVLERIERKRNPAPAKPGAK